MNDCFACFFDPMRLSKWLTSLLFAYISISIYLPYMHSYLADISLPPLPITNYCAFSFILYCTLYFLSQEVNVPFLFFFYFSAFICCFFVCSLRIRRVARRSTASNHKWRQRRLQRRAGGARDRRDASARSAAVKLKCKLQLPLNCPSCCCCCC